MRRIMNPSLRNCDKSVIDTFMNNPPKSLNIEELQAFKIDVLMNPSKKLKEYQITDELDDNDDVDIDDIDNFEYKSLYPELTEDTYTHEEKELMNDDLISEADSESSAHSVKGTNNYNYSNVGKFIDPDSDDEERSVRSVRSDRSSDLREYDRRESDRSSGRREYDRGSDRRESDHREHDRRSSSITGVKSGSVNRAMTGVQENSNPVLRRRKMAMMKELRLLEKKEIYSTRVPRLDIDCTIAEFEDEMEILRDEAKRDSFVKKAEMVVLMSVLIIEAFMRYIGMDFMSGWYIEVKDTIEEYHNEFRELYVKYGEHVSMGPEMAILGGIVFSGFRYCVTRNDNNPISAFFTNGFGASTPMFHDPMRPIHRDSREDTLNSLRSDF